jgi:hypothetical protein
VAALLAAGWRRSLQQQLRLCTGHICTEGVLLHMLGTAVLHGCGQACEAECFQTAASRQKLLCS